MKILLALLFALNVCCSFFTNAKNSTQISVESLFKNQDILAAHLSPTGKYLAVIADTDVEAKVYIFTTKDMRPHTAPFEWQSSRIKRGKTEIGLFTWVSDERFIASLMIKVGAFDSPMLTGEYFASNADGSKKTDLSLIKNAYNNMGRIRGFSIIDTLDEDGKHILIQDSSTGPYPTAYKLNTFSGKRKKVTRSPAHFGTLHTDNSGEIRLATGITNDDEEEIFYRETAEDDWQQIAKFKSSNGGMKVLGFSADNKGVYVFLPANTKRVNGLYYYDFVSKKETLLSQRDPQVDEQVIWGGGS